MGAAPGMLIGGLSKEIDPTKSLAICQTIESMGSLSLSLSLSLFHPPKGGGRGGGGGSLVILNSSSLFVILINRKGMVSSLLIRKEVSLKEKNITNVLFHKLPATKRQATTAATRHLPE